MSVINSRAGLSEDDSDITIINPSINEHNAETLSSMQERTLTEAITNNQFSSLNYPDDFVFVHHDPLENAKKLEETLMNYIRDLKRESNSQLDCDKNLVTRLIDLIRPAYSNNDQKLAELNRIRDDIGVLHDKRFVQQKEKLEELQTEINRINRMLFTASNDQSIYQNQMNSYSIYDSMAVTTTINGNSQWTEIESDAKKLQEIIQTQKDQIAEIVTLISQTVTPTSSIQRQPAINNQSEKSDTKNQPTQVPPPSSSSAVKSDFLSDILSRLKFIGTQPTVLDQNRDKTQSLATTILTQHSPDSSPNESMQTITEPINQSELTDETPVEPKPINEPPTEPKPADETPVELKPINEPPTEPKPADETPVEPKPINEPPTEPKPADETPVEPKPINEPPTEPKPADETPVEPKPINQPPTKSKPADETPVVPPPIVKPPVEPKPPNRQPIVGPGRLINPVPIVPLTPDPPRQCPVCNHDFPSTCDDVEMYEHIDRCLFPVESFQPPKEYECPCCSKKYPIIEESAYLQHMNDCYNSQFD